MTTLNIVLIAVVVAVLGAVGFYIWRREQESPAPWRSTVIGPGPDRLSPLVMRLGPLTATEDVPVVLDDVGISS